MRRLALTIVLACVLSVVARAGEIPTTGVVAPTPSPVKVYGEIHTTGVTAAGEIPSTGAPVPLTIILTIISIVP